MKFRLRLASGTVLLGYLSRELLSKVMTTTIIVVALMEILALLEQVTEIMHRHLGLTGVLYYAVMHMPLLFGNAMPIAVLIGTLLTLLQLTTSNEISIMRAAGLSTPGLIKLLLPTVIALGVLCGIVDDQITPRTEQALAQWWNATSPNAPNDWRNYWIRAHNDLININFLSAGGAMMKQVTVYHRDHRNLLQKVTTLADVHYIHGRWYGTPTRVLSVVSPTRVDLLDTPPGQSIRLDWPASLTPEYLIQLTVSYTQSINTMLEEQRGALPSSQSPSFFLTEILGRIMLPVTFTVMLLLAVPVVYIPPRAGTRSWLPIWCLGAGLLFIVFQGLLRALGNAGTLPSLMAIFVGILIFILGVITVLLRIEER
ncbi:LptF/LptG family permease [Komagataeibacter intermedius]|uniref:Transporter n=2 Tax=Komagataeibacter intermedius TaxID=66229 RepID=A0A0N0MF16_9PROT|nr:LptF/LptG family permease [Komagataeibacter intermedius]KPH87096.1 transporter [Komagataeibacter intermedius AF2]MCF3636675.1 LptF/LptG family permease [Komagataeibacter intermedius]GAN88170.1 transporter YjgP/YjgQ [Komagataeibacter intermedius TF2]GBQ69076.1 transporter YjgP/YjgQ [Komagataeibacter intermedius NRIC 0521]